MVECANDQPLNPFLWRIRMNELLDQKKGLIEYLKLKVIQEDWHAVADAAMDIREVVAKIEIFQQLLEKK